MNANIPPWNAMSFGTPGGRLNHSNDTDTNVITFKTMREKTERLFIEVNPVATEKSNLKPRVTTSGYLTELPSLNEAKQIRPERKPDIAASSTVSHSVSDVSKQVGKGFLGGTEFAMKHGGLQAGEKHQQRQIEKVSKLAAGGMAGGGGGKGTPPPDFTQITIKGQVKRTSPLLGWAYSQGLAEKAFVVQHIWVVRRGLDVGPMDLPRGFTLAHSALLLKTNCGKYILVEYTNSLEKGEVLFREVAGVADDDVEFRESTYHWKKQRHGDAPPVGSNGRSVTVTDVLNITCAAALGEDYDVRGHNCHQVQQSTRQALGMPVRRCTCPFCQIGG